jgi:hypothetical protein
VTGDRHRFPTAVDFGFWRKSCFLSESTQQAIRVEAQEIRRIAPHRILERTIEKANVFEWELLRCELWLRD